MDCEVSDGVVRHTSFYFSLDDVGWLRASITPYL